MKKNLYLTVLTIVTVFCIIIGSVYHIVGWGFNFFDGLFDFVDGYDSSSKKDAGPLVKSGTIELDDFTSIDADVSVMNLTIEPGDQATITYSGNSKLKPKYRVDNGTLILTQNSVHNMWWGNKKCNVTITVSADQYCELFDISADVGDININRISGEQLFLNADVGDIDVERCTFEAIDIQADVGDVEMEHCDFYLLNIDNSIGNIDVVSANDLSDYYIEMDTSIGEVTFNDHDYRRSYEQPGSSSDRKITLYNDTGDIRLSDR